MNTQTPEQLTQRWQRLYRALRKEQPSVPARWQLNYSRALICMGYAAECSPEYATILPAIFGNPDTIQLFAARAATDAEARIFRAKDYQAKQELKWALRERQQRIGTVISHTTEPSTIASL